MPTPYQILNARVKQKIATEADWLAVENILGPILPGEQAFVWDPSGNPVNFKIGDGTKLFSQLPYFIAYYSNTVNLGVLSYLGVTGDMSIPSVFRDKTLLTDLVFINNSAGAVTLNIGTTAGASDIRQVVIPTGAVTIGVNEYFQASTTIYFSGLTGVNYTMFVLYTQLDRAPVTPPAGGSGTFRFPKGFRGTFEPVYPGHENDAWDFTTGLGKTGTAWENCALSGTNGTQDLSDLIEVGYSIGDGINDIKGSNTITLSESQLPKFRVPLFFQYTSPFNSDPPTGDDPVALNRNASPSYLNYQMQRGLGTLDHINDPAYYAGKSAPVGSGAIINSQPKSIVSLRFVAITD